MSNAVAKTVVKDVTDSKDEKVQEIKQELQQSVNSNGKATEKFVTKPVETPSHAAKQPGVKPVGTLSQQATVKPVETSKGTPEVQPVLPEVTVETVDVTEEIPFKEMTQEDPELYQGLTRRVEGTKGSEKNNV